MVSCNRCRGLDDCTDSICHCHIRTPAQERTFSRKHLLGKVCEILGRGKSSNSTPSAKIRASRKLKRQSLLITKWQYGMIVEIEEVSWQASLSLLWLAAVLLSQAALRCDAVKVTVVRTALDAHSRYTYLYYVNVKVITQSSGCLTIDWRATCFAAIEARQRRPALRRQALVDAVSRMVF